MTAHLRAKDARRLLLGIGAALFVLALGIGLGLATSGAAGARAASPAPSRLAAAVRSLHDGHAPEALLQFEVLAREGVPEAHDWLGRMLLSGEAAEVDTERGLHHLHIAAEAGVVPAQRRLGLYLLETDVDGMRDVAAARQWLQRAALAGDRVAAQRLYALAESAAGPGAEPGQDKDLVGAYAWLCLTPDAHTTGAACRRLAERLTPLQRHDAREVIARLTREASASRSAAR